MYLGEETVNQENKTEICDSYSIDHLHQYFINDIKIEEDIQKLTQYQITNLIKNISSQNDDDDVTISKKYRLNQKQQQSEKQIQKSQFLTKDDVKIVMKKLKEQNYYIVKYLASGGEADIFFGKEQDNMTLDLVFRICKMNNKQELNQLSIDQMQLNFNAIYSQNQNKFIKVEESNKNCFLMIHIMEYCEISLQDEMKKQVEENTFFPFSVLIRLFSQLLIELIILEGNSILHCDIKPSNILKRKVKNRDIGHQYLFCDFGIFVKTDNKKNQTYDSKGFTISYCPPEQINGYVNHSSDIYSLGKTFVNVINHTISQLKKENVQEAIVFSQEKIKIGCSKYIEILIEIKNFIQQNMVNDKQDMRKDSQFIIEYLLYQAEIQDWNYESILLDVSKPNIGIQKIINLQLIIKLWKKRQLRVNIWNEMDYFVLKQEQFRNDKVNKYEKEIFRVYEEDIFENQLFVTKIDSSFSYFYTVGKCHLLRYGHQDALNCFEKALEILQMQEYSLDKYYNKSYILKNIGDCHFYLGEIIKFKNNYLQELNEISAFCLTQISNPHLIFIFLNLAKCLTIIGDFDQAIEFYYQASYAFLQVYDDDQSKLNFNDFKPQDQSIHNEISIKVIDFFRKKKFKKEWNIILLKSFCHLALLYLYKGKEIQFGFKLIEQICEIIETLDQQNIILRMIAFETKASFYSYFEQYDQEIEQYFIFRDDLINMKSTQLMMNNKSPLFLNIKYHIMQIDIKILNYLGKKIKTNLKFKYQRQTIKKYPYNNCSEQFQQCVDKTKLNGCYYSKYFKEALYYFKDQILNSIIFQRKLKTICCLEDIFEQQGQFKEQLTEQNFALDKRKELYPDDHFCLVQSLGRVGRSYKNLGDIQLAIEYFKQQKKMYKRITKQSKEGLSQFLFIYDSEFPSISLQNEYNNQQSRTLQLADCYLHLAACELENKQYQTWIKYFKKATQLYADNNQVGYCSKMYSYYKIGQNYFQNNEMAEACKAFIKAYDLKYDIISHITDSKDIIIYIIKCTIKLSDKENKQKFIKLLFQRTKIEFFQLEMEDFEFSMDCYLQGLSNYIDLAINQETQPIYISPDIQDLYKHIEQLYQKRQNSNYKFMFKYKVFEVIKKLSEFSMQFTNKLLQDMSESSELYQNDATSYSFQFMLAKCYQYINDYDNSLTFYSQSIEIQISLNQKYSPEVLNSIKHIIELINTIKDSQLKSDLNEIYYDFISSYFTEIQEDNVIRCSEIGQIYQSINNFNNAIRFYKQSLDIKEKLPSKDENVINYQITQIALCCINLGDFNYFFDYMDMERQSLSYEEIKRILDAEQ